MNIKTLENLTIIENKKIGKINVHLQMMYRDSKEIRGKENERS